MYMYMYMYIYDIHGIMFPLYTLGDSGLAVIMLRILNPYELSCSAWLIVNFVSTLTMFTTDSLKAWMPIQRTINLHVRCAHMHIHCCSCWFTNGRIRSSIVNFPTLGVSHWKCDCMWIDKKNHLSTGLCLAEQMVNQHLGLGLGSEGSLLPRPEEVRNDHMLRQKCCIITFSPIDFT